VLTAVVTLGTAALLLLTPLQSRLRSDSLGLAESSISGDKTQLGYVEVTRRGMPYHAKLETAEDNIFHSSGGPTVIVWGRGPGSSTIRDLYDTDTDDRRRAPPPIVLEARPSMPSAATWSPSPPTTTTRSGGPTTRAPVAASWSK
jgi:hypothetical protein